MAEHLVRGRELPLRVNSVRAQGRIGFPEHVCGLLNHDYRTAVGWSAVGRRSAVGGSEVGGWTRSKKACIMCDRRYYCSIITFGFVTLVLLRAFFGLRSMDWPQ